mmetsp:Transcript_31773/g.73985  ORF Transcript_31773/g.73985 Transcript_31773/m.73985 type:complete len:235 (-) Transcript_31773:75-779(-)
MRPAQCEIVTSAQFCHTCFVCSASQRHESRYSPAGIVAGTTTWSTMLTLIIGLASCEPGVQPGVGLSPRALSRGASPQHQLDQSDARPGSGGANCTLPSGHEPGAPLSAHPATQSCARHHERLYRGRPANSAGTVAQQPAQSASRHWSAGQRISAPVSRHAGMGTRAHMEPRGVVTLPLAVTRGMGTRVLLLRLAPKRDVHRISEVSPAKARWPRWKHCSVTPSCGPAPFLQRR